MDTIRTIEEMKDKSRWSVVATESDSQKGIQRGVYRICPCCMYPERLKQEEIKELIKQLKGTAAVPVLERYVIFTPETKLILAK